MLTTEEGCRKPGPPRLLQLASPAEGEAKATLAAIECAQMDDAEDLLLKGDAGDVVEELSIPPRTAATRRTFNRAHLV